MKSMYLDVVYVVDATNCGAMIENARKQITRFGRELPAFSNAYVCAVQNIREKLVFFGDFASEGESAIIETEFYDSTRRAEFLANLDRDDIKMSGGDLPENGLEALFVAMQSDWRQVDFDKEERIRHIIVLITDAYPLFLQERKGAIGYDSDAYPADIMCLQDIWYSAGEPESAISISKWDKRLVLVAPYGSDDKCHSWEDVMLLDNAFCIGSVVGCNCEGVELCSNSSFVEIFRGDDVWIHDLPPEPKPEPEERVVVPKINRIAESDEESTPEKVFDVDVVLVLDMSGRMGMHIDFLQYLVPGIGDLIGDVFARLGKKMEKFRLKHIGFADYAYEGDEALLQTDFLEEYKPYKDSDYMIVPAPWWKYVRKGFEPMPENGLEALYAAMTSDWTELKNGRGGRQIIILMTDKYPLHLMERSGKTGYPTDELPKTVDQLRLVWEGKAGDTKLSKSNKRLLLFAPGGEDEQGHSWKPISEWENTVYFEVELDNYTSDVNIVDALKQYIN